MKTDNETLTEEPSKPEPQRLRTSRIPHEVSARALLSPRITGKSRRLFMRARDIVVDVPRQEHDEQATYCRSLKRLSIQQLVNRQTQIKRRLRTIAKFLDNHTLESFRKPALDEKQLLEYRRGWLTQEIESRCRKAPVEDIKPWRWALNSDEILAAQQYLESQRNNE